MAVTSNDISSSRLVFGKAQDLGGFQHVQSHRAVRGDKHLTIEDRRARLDHRLDSARVDAVFGLLDKEHTVQIRQIRGDGQGQ